MVYALLVFSLAGIVATQPAKAAPEIPIYYGYGGYPRIQTNISWGTPAQAAIPAIFDTGSIGFWTYRDGAIINDGSQFLGSEGPCNKTVKEVFNYRKSSSHRGLKNLTDALTYSYGGNGKIVNAYQEVNDTMSFGKASCNQIRNVQVALSNFTVVRQLDEDCAVSVDDFDQSILGVGPYGVGGAYGSTNTPSFRLNLRTTAAISAKTMSIWMNKAPKNVEGTYTGTALFGQNLPKAAYTGPLVSVKQVKPDQPYIGYYPAIPSLSVNGKRISSVDMSVKNCLLDSGTGQDMLPFSSMNLTKYSKIFTYETKDGFEFTSWKGSCDSIPTTATFDFTFPGAVKGKDALVKIPIRSYVRGIADGVTDIPKNICPLTLTLDNYGGCVLGSPFFTNAALHFDDDRKTISIAQGGVA